MKKARTISSLMDKIDNILSVTIESIVPDLRPLTAAFFLSTSDEVSRVHQHYPQGHMIYYALNAACNFHKDTALRDMYIADGFFNEQLEHFLGVAKKDRVAGARLMPVFCTALTNADMLKIPDALQKKIIAHIEWQRKKDGFAITELSLNNIVVAPASDVVPG